MTDRFSTVVIKLVDGLAMHNRREVVLPSGQFNLLRGKGEITVYTNSIKYK